MDIINDKLLQYCEAFSEPESPLLKQLNRDTHLKVGHAGMLSGHLQGRLLSFLSHLQQPKRILEIGTYTGYSALCLAEGLAGGGKLTSIDPNEETTHFAQQYISCSPLASKIELLTAQAQQLIPTLPEGFDLVFIDADKKNYGLYFDLVIDKVNKGGLIIADNVLWKGRVLDEQMDKDTQVIHSFNQKVQQDARVAPLLLPVRDGLLLMRKL